MCVLATAMDAFDRGCRVVIVEDAVGSSSDLGHDAALSIYHTRFAEQIGVVQAAELVERLIS